MKVSKVRLLFLTILGIFIANVWAQNEGQASAINLWTAWQMPKFWVVIAFVIVATLLLWMGKMRKWVRFALMLAAFFTFGILAVLPLGDWVSAMGMHPSPMCVIEKPVLFLNSRGVIPIFFVSIFVLVAVLTVLSNKSFCAHTCPIGALQEMLHRIPTPKYTLPFKIANSVRFLIFVVFVILVFAADISLYNYVNAFHILHFEWDWTLLLPLLISTVGALFFFRPFCYAICPLGLFTWVLEQFSITRVKLDTATCNNCQKCVKKTVCPAVPAILEKKKIRPDCFACGDCIEICPQKSFTFKNR